MSTGYAWPPGYPESPGHEPYPVVRHGGRAGSRQGHRSGGGSRHGRFGSLIGGVLVALVLLGVVGTVLGRQQAPTTNCGTRCPRPPVTGAPEPAEAVYKSVALGWSLQYAPSAGMTVAERTSTTVAFNVGGYPITYSGVPAAGRTAAQLAHSYASRSVPGARLVYTIPRAQLGFVLGYGAVYDTYVQTTGGSSQHVRYIVMTAIRAGVAVTVQAIGPFRASSQADEHPNPSGTPIADFIGRSSNTVTWPGEPQL